MEKSGRRFVFTFGHFFAGVAGIDFILWALVDQDNIRLLYGAAILTLFAIFSAVNHAASHLCSMNSALINFTKEHQNDHDWFEEAVEGDVEGKFTKPVDEND